MIQFEVLTFERRIFGSPLIFEITKTGENWEIHLVFRHEEMYKHYLKSEKKIQKYMSKVLELIKRRQPVMQIYNFTQKEFYE